MVERVTHPTHGGAHTAAVARQAATDADKKRIERHDPQELQRKAAIEAHEADPENNPAPQVGLSSSELNTSHPAMKKQATKEAQTLPTNGSPEGAPSERKAETAEKKFAKEHEG